MPKKSNLDCPIEYEKSIAFEWLCGFLMVLYFLNRVFSYVFICRCEL